MMEETALIEKFNRELIRQETKEKEKIETAQEEQHMNQIIDHLIDLSKDSIDDLATYLVSLNKQEFEKIQEILEKTNIKEPPFDIIMATSKNLFHLKQRGLETRAITQTQKYRDQLSTYRNSLLNKKQSRPRTSMIAETKSHLEQINELKNCLDEEISEKEITNIDSFYELVEYSDLSEEEKTSLMVIAMNKNLKKYLETLKQQEKTTGETIRANQEEVFKSIQASKTYPIDSEKLEKVMDIINDKEKFQMAINAIGFTQDFIDADQTGENLSIVREGIIDELVALIQQNPERDVYELFEEGYAPKKEEKFLIVDPEQAEEKFLIVNPEQTEEKSKEKKINLFFLSRDRKIGSIDKTFIEEDIQFKKGKKGISKQNYKDIAKQIQSIENGENNAFGNICGKEYSFESWRKSLKEYGVRCKEGQKARVLYIPVGQKDAIIVQASLLYSKNSIAEADTRISNSRSKLDSLIEIITTGGTEYENLKAQHQEKNRDIMKELGVTEAPEESSATKKRR